MSSALHYIDEEENSTVEFRIMDSGIMGRDHN